MNGKNMNKIRTAFQLHLLQSLYHESGCRRKINANVTNARDSGWTRTMGKKCGWYLSDRGEKNPGALSFDAMYRVRPGGIHVAILFLIYSGRVSLSR